ncbi:MAG: ABC transporter substrate-binding protein, partial [Longicatena sp.]
MKKLKLLIVSTLVFALVAGCSSKPATEGGTEGGNTGGTGNNKIVVATDTDLSTMDHHIATDGTSFIAQTLAFSGLTELDENNMAIPEIAETWDISEDGTVYTFHLADAKWSNGTPLTANDF